MQHLIIGIESSCDETAVGIYDSSRGVIVNEIYSQISLHAQYGGVVPEIASRSHLEKMPVILEAALNKANVSLDDATAIAVTSKPGLPGSLLVGLCFAKGIAYTKGKKLIGVDHLAGHIFSAHIEHEIPFPYLCLTASGGHTSLYLVRNFNDYVVLGSTTDDAAGEAFDKTAKLMNLPYPGGPVIEHLAKAAHFVDYFQFPRSKDHSCNFSFSGLKTAVLYHLVNRNAYSMEHKRFTADEDLTLKEQTASSLLVCIGDIFEQKLKRAFHIHPEVRAISFVGGVACNKYLKDRVSNWATKNRLAYFSPSPKYCTDNGAMIAFVGYHKALQHKFDAFTLDIL